jgi:putative SOS response-associated peptidase YedK
MCNLYSLTEGQPANLPLFPGVFPDQLAPIVRNSADGRAVMARAKPVADRELVLARWGMPGPPQYGGQPVTNIRHVASPHWRGWLGIGSRCVVPATSFCEYAHQAAQDADLVRAERGQAAVRLRRLVDPLARHAGAEKRAGRGRA